MSNYSRCVRFLKCIYVCKNNYTLIYIDEF
nr:MAG TPA: hypothetical protein [Caudoviricetes sp.]